MTVMKRTARDLLALGIAAAATALVTLVASWDPMPVSAVVPEPLARESAAFYLDATPREAELQGSRWRIATADDVAWIDAATGDLVEVEFGPADRP